MRPWIVGLGIGIICFNSLAFEFSGQVNLEHRQFFEDGQQGLGKGQSSIVLQPEFYWDFHGGNTSVIFVPFGRLDSMDDQRSHADIRELLLLGVKGDYELRAGIGKVFWGVTESIHLVDVINQTDAVESLDGEDKLGQPMLHVTAVKDWGVWDGFLLPYFRERTFAGKDGRLRPEPPVSTHAEYESSREEKHIDASLRYSKMLGDWDVGLSYFVGTNRDPYLQYHDTRLIPFYAQMDQFGLDVQGIIGDWLWKLESIYRNSLDEQVSAVTGFEYTYVGLLDTQWDLGVIAEYLYDSRGENLQSPYQNDLFAGARFTLNDAEGTEILLGVTQDLDDTDVYFGKLEASSRINNHLKWRVDAWMFDDSIPDDFIEVSIEYYF